MFSSRQACKSPCNVMCGLDESNVTLSHEHLHQYDDDLAECSYISWLPCIALLPRFPSQYEQLFCGEIALSRDKPAMILEELHRLWCTHAKDWDVVQRWDVNLSSAIEIGKPRNCLHLLASAYIGCLRMVWSIKHTCIYIYINIHLYTELFMSFILYYIILKYVS